MMRSRHPRRRRWVFRGWLLLPLLALACRTPGPTPAPASPAATVAATIPRATAPAATATPAEVELGPIDPAWVSSGGQSPGGPNAPPRTVVEFRFAPPARITADLNVLGRRLPMHLADLFVDSLAKSTRNADLPIDAQLLAALAPDRAVALVDSRPSNATHACVAVPFARTADAAATAERMGAALSQRAGAVERQVASGQRRWTAVKDATLLIADTYEVLFGSCAQALAATWPPLPSEDMVAVLNLDATIRQMGGAGADLATEFGNDLEKAARESARAPGKHGIGPGLSPEAMRRLGEHMGHTIMQSARVRIALSASTQDGLVVTAALEPKPGTALAQSASTSAAYALDPALPIVDDRAAVFAWGSLGAFEPLLRAGMPPAMGATAGGAASKRSALDDFLSVFTGGGSCVLESSDAPPSVICSLPLRPGADARAALDRYVALARALASMTPAAGAHRFSPRIRKDIVEFDWTVDLAALTPEQAQMVRSYLGGNVSHYAAAVRNGRLLQLRGPTARARLVAWKDRATGASAPPRPPLLEDALARTRGASFILWLDPLALLMKILAHANDPGSRQARIMLSALPGLATTRVPMVVDAPAGPAYTAELRIPMATFDNIATLIGPFMGMMGR